MLPTPSPRVHLLAFRVITILQDMPPLQPSHRRLTWSPPYPSLWDSKWVWSLLFLIVLPLLQTILLSGPGHFLQPLIALMCGYPTVLLDTLFHILITWASIWMASSMWPPFPWPTHCQRQLLPLGLSFPTAMVHTALSSGRSHCGWSRVIRCEILGEIWVMQGLVGQVHVCMVYSMCK